MDTNQKNKPNDRRIERTKNFLRVAILDLAVENNGINGITIKDITEQANVARSSFYVHYSDKEDLLYDALEWKFREFSDGFQKKYNPNKPPRAYDMFEYVSQEPTFFLVMLNSVGTMKGYDLSQRLFVDSLQGYFSDLQFSVPEEVIRLHVTGVFFNLVNWWLKPENNQSPAVMTSYYNDLVYSGLLNIFGVTSSKEIKGVLNSTG